MSQFFLGTSDANIPSDVPNQFVTDVNSPSIPDAHIEKVLGGQTNSNNIKGIQTDGSSGGNTLTVQLTNRISGTATTTDATPTNVFTFPLGATPGTYLFFDKTVAYDLTGGLSAAYSNFFCVRTDGTNGHAVTSGSYFTSEEGVLSALDAAYTVDVAGNIFKLVVTGIAGKTVHWLNLTDYIFVS